MTDWRNNLESFLKTTERRKEQALGFNMTDFLRDIVMPAFEEITLEFVKYGRDVTTRLTEASATLVVQWEGREEIMYRIQGRTFPNGVRPYAEIRCHQRKGLRLVTVESMIRSGGAEYTIRDITREELIQNFLENYTKRVKPEQA